MNNQQQQIVLRKNNIIIPSANSSRAQMKNEMNFPLKQFNENQAQRQMMAKRGQEVLFEAQHAWYANRDFRNRRMRSRNYYRNRPGELMDDPEGGGRITEDEYIERQGRIPYKMNQIRPVVMNLIGQYRSNKTQRIAYGRNRDDNDAAEMMTEALRYVCDVNKVSKADVRAFIELLIGGLYGWKTGYKNRPQFGRYDVTIDPFDSTKFFFNPDVDDDRLLNLSICGELHDLSLDQIISMFAQSRYEADWIKGLYARNVDSWAETWGMIGFQSKDTIDFLQSTNPKKNRVIEVWREEYSWKRFIHDYGTGTFEESDMNEDDVAELNVRRMLETTMGGGTFDTPIVLQEEYTPHWVVYYLTPMGEVLLARRTPYWHGLHPYSFGFANFIDGEVWGLVEDIIDPQRLVNRITTAIDYMFSVAAKGVLLIPEDSIPKGMTPEEFATQWRKFNGVIVYTPKQGQPAPQQITVNSVPAGIFGWSREMQQMIKDVSGVTGPVMGDTPGSGTPAALYDQQVMQASVTNRHYFDSFYETRKDRDAQVCQLIGQYYEEPRMIGLQSRRVDGSRIIRYNPQQVKDMEFDVVVSDAPDTPVTRNLMEKTLTEHLNAQRLTFRQFLQLSSHPKADLILAVIEKSNPILAEEKMDPQKAAMMKQQLVAQAQAGDKDAVAYLNQM